MADYYPKLGTNLTLQQNGFNTYGYVGESAGDKLYFRQWDKVGVAATLAPTVTNPETHSIQLESFLGYPQSKVLGIAVFDPLIIDGMRFLCTVSVSCTQLVTASFKIYDGEYDYTSTVDFPSSGAGSESIAVKGAGVLQTLATISVLTADTTVSRGTGALLTVYSIDEVIDMSAATQALVTLIIEV